MSTQLENVKQSVVMEVVGPADVGELRETVVTTEAIPAPPKPVSAKECVDGCTWPLCQTIKKAERIPACYRGLPATE